MYPRKGISLICFAQPELFSHFFVVPLRNQKHLNKNDRNHSKHLHDNRGQHRGCCDEQGNKGEV